MAPALFCMYTVANGTQAKMTDNCLLTRRFCRGAAKRVNGVPVD